MTAPKPPFEEAPALKRFTMHARHGFFGRQGGVSTGHYRSLNCGLGTADEPTRVAENRHRAAQAVGGDGARLITLRQIHSPRCITVDAPYDGPAPEADALVTQRANLVLGVLAADCAPVLLLDPHAGVAGAAHAGWRGAVAGVLESTVEAMTALGADPARITAAVGPCLSQSSFEVGPDLVNAVLEVSPWADTLIEPGADDRSHFDLKRYCVGRLARLGVAHIDALADDTLSEDEGYFSYRRSNRTGEPDSGRNLSAIMLLA